MSAVPDELDKLLCDCRKTISDNALFLKGLVEDVAEVDENPEGSEEDEEESFEEL
jgi:hypothetical protein